MYIKLLTVVGFVAMATAGNVDVGVQGGSVIYEQNVTASPAIWRQVHNLTVTANNTDEVISHIVVIDNRPERDGEAKVVEGGVGKKNITIELKSPAVFRGYDFTIKVSAAPEKVYLNSQAPKNPTSTGIETQNAQVPYPKDIHVNQGQKPKNDDDIILQNSKPTASSTTEATIENNDTQQQINPALVGQEQTRLNRDTEDQKTDKQVPLPVHTTGSVNPTKNNKTNDNTNKTQVKFDDDFKKAISSIFSDNSTQKNKDSKVNVQVKPTHPQFEIEDELDVAHSGDQQRTVRGTETGSAVPALNKEQKKDDNQTTSTQKIYFSSTNEDSKVNVQVQPVHPQFEVEDKLDVAHSGDQQRTVHGTETGSAVPALNKERKEDENQTTSTPKSTISSTTAKNIQGGEKYEKVIPLSDNSSSSRAAELTTEATKLAENVKPTHVLDHHLKGYHAEHKHAVPLPYVH